MMEKLFKHILLPIGLDRTTDDAITTAVEFANRMNCHLHLLHINSSPLLRFGHALTLKNGRLSELYGKYAPQVNKGQKLYISMETGDVETQVTEYCLTHNIDLVFMNEELGRRSLFGTSLSINRLGMRSGCPVLSIKSSELLSEHKIIVMPIGNSLPLTKIRVVIYLAKLFNADIHLVTVNRGNNEMAYLQKAFQVLKDNTDLNIKCQIMEGEALADVTMNYAHEVGAGLIVVNPGPESSLSGFVNKMFSRFVSSESKVPVMTVV